MKLDVISIDLRRTVELARDALWVRGRGETAFAIDAAKTDKGGNKHVLLN